MIPPKRARLLAAGLLVVVALAGCQQDRQPSATPAATTSTVASTTTKPPVTAAERAWPAGVAKLRRRMDRVFFESRVVLTQAKLREYIRTGRSCAPGLARLGLPTVLLRQPAATAARACGDYERAAAVYQRVAPLLGTAAVSKIGDLLEAAAEHEGSGSNGLRRAEADAKVILA